MKKIILHWTAGGYYPNACEKECYHFLVDKDGKIHKGKFAPENNLKCTKGCYAAHTGGGNTGAIGVAVCAMAGFKNKQNGGIYPIKPAQFEAFVKLCADLAIKYNIPVNSSTVMTHYEFGKKNPLTQSKGKPDIEYLASNPSLPPNKIGDFIRDKIKWYYQKSEKQILPKSIGMRNLIQAKTP